MCAYYLDHNICLNKLSDIHYYYLRYFEGGGGEIESMNENYISFSAYELKAVYIKEKKRKIPTDNANISN